MLMGGRAAEEVALHDIRTGASNDIERATAIARKMICEWGMSEKLGPVAYGKKEEQVFLGKEFGHSREYSEQTAQSIDAEVSRIVDSSYKKAVKMLRDNMDILNGLAQALIEHETLDSGAVDKITKSNGDYSKIVVSRKKARKKAPSKKTGESYTASATKATTEKSETKGDGSKETASKSTTKKETKLASARSKAKVKSDTKAEETTEKTKKSETS